MYSPKSIGLMKKGEVVAVTRVKVDCFGSLFFVCCRWRTVKKMRIRFGRKSDLSLSFIPFSAFYSTFLRATETKLRYEVRSCSFGLQAGIRSSTAPPYLVTITPDAVVD